MARGGRLAAIPNGAGVVKRLKMSISILDGVVQEPVSANWVDIVLIPAAEVVAIPCHEAVRQGGLPADRPGCRLFNQLVLAMAQMVVKAGQMGSEYEVAVQDFGGRAQGVVCE